MADPPLPPYNVGDLAPGARRSAPAAQRNREPIMEVLADWLPDRGVVLEVASGTGEHARAFAERFPALTWQPSDPDPAALASIGAWQADGPDNLRTPIQLDVRETPWPVERCDALLCINMVHISPWEASLGLLDGARASLSPGAPLILYGPWYEEGVDPAPSNRAFDESLRQRDGRWGIRTVESFAKEAAVRGLDLAERRAMPANNLMLRFVRSDRP